MSKKHTVILSIGLGIICASAFYLVVFAGSNAAKPHENKETFSSSSSSDAAKTIDQPSSPAETGTGTYLNYSPEAVENTTGKRVLFFHAPWCPQCRSLEASIQSGAIPSDVTIFKVDYDSNQKLRQKYGVTLQTTVVLLDDNGEEAKKFVPYDNPSLQAVKENLL